MDDLQSMKKYFTHFFLFYLLFAGFANGQTTALVELFTSEGDDLCQVSEEIVARQSELARKSGSNVFILQYHVDYWNNRGWKDPYSKYQFTMRQENYSRVLSEKELYTPEVVINGTKSFSGSKEQTMKAELSSALSKKLPNVLSLRRDSIARDTLFLTYTSSLENNNSVFKIAITQNGLKSTVTAGQNANKSMVHNNVVRILYSFDGVKKSFQVKVPLNKFQLNNSCQIIGFIQRKQTMEVLAVDACAAN
jgi:hypothetical protein